MPSTVRPGDFATGERQSSLSRRQILRGAGACIALPLLASHAASRILAADATAGGKLAATATGAPLRWP